jgi:hypothetical protein
MKKLFLIYSIFIAIIGCLVMTYCDKKKIQEKTTTKEHMDAGTKTIENMQSAYI